MTELMDDPETPPNKEASSNLLRFEDMEAAFVQVEFLPKDPELPAIPSFRRGFPSRTLAMEYIASLNPDPSKQFGSPIQAALKRAALLRLSNPDILNNYEVQATILEGITNEQPGTGQQPPSRVRAPNREPVSSGPPRVDLAGLIGLGSTLPESAVELPEDGGEAEVGGEVEGSET